MTTTTATTTTGTIESAEGAAELLGGKKVFRRPIRAASDLRRALRSGLPFGAFDTLLDKLEMSATELADLLGIAKRTLARRKARGRFSPTESDRLYRVAHIAFVATEALGSIEKARLWLQRPNRALGGDAPLSYLDTQIGEREIEELLLRLGHGIYS